MKESKKKGKLLIAEDEDDLCAIIQERLEMSSFDVLSARNGQEAFAMLEKNRVDAVLSDINMPKMTGLELLSRLRKQGSEIPFVILTGCGDLDHLREALRLGANDFLDKPVDHKLLVSVMEKAAKLGQMIEQIEAEEASFFESQAESTEKLTADLKAKQGLLWRLRRATAIMKANSEVYLKGLKKTG